MNLWKTVLLGPESVWLAIYGAALLIAASNQPPTVSGNLRLEGIGFYLSLGGPVLSFLVFAFHSSRKWWLLGRTVLAGVIGLPMAVTALCRAIEYHDSRNSGVGMAWVLYLSLGFGVLLTGALVTVLILAWK